MLAVAALAFGLDRISKLVINRSLPEGESRPIIPGILHLTHVENPGAAFGLLPGQAGLLALFALVAVIGIVGAARRWRSPLAHTGLGLLLGGATGNLVDRARVGTVTDFIDLRVWPVFNVADIAIVVGSGLLALFLLRASPEGEAA